MFIDPHNHADQTGYGGVSCEFQIMKCEVTVREYAKFLNRVAAHSDPHELWVTAMGEHVITDLGQGGIRKDVPQCIGREGQPGAWKYSPVPEREDCPVFFVSFFSALRYADWMHHGGRNGDTEFGAYDLSRGMTVSRSADAKVWLPSENEWYKAAYFQPEKRGGPKGSYWQFPFCTHTREGQKIDSEIGCKDLELFFDPAFTVIEILAGTLIDPHEVARADRFSDEVYGNDFGRVKNFSTER